MTSTTLLLIGGALLFLWPAAAKLLSLGTAKPAGSVLEQVLSTATAAASAISKTPPPSQPQTFEHALAALASVRRRLNDTKQLDEQTKAAIERVTQALVAGSADE